MKSKKKKMENKDSSLRSTETTETPKVAAVFSPLPMNTVSSMSLNGATKTPEVASVYWLRGVNVFE